MIKCDNIERCCCSRQSVRLGARLKRKVKFSNVDFARRFWKYISAKVVGARNFPASDWASLLFFLIPS